MATTQDDLIAELQRANAELRQERDAALTQRDSDYSERIAHQAATIDVLKAMSASPGEPQRAVRHGRYREGWRHLGMSGSIGNRQEWTDA